MSIIERPFTLKIPAPVPRNRVVSQTFKMMSKKIACLRLPVVRTR